MRRIIPLVLIIRFFKGWNTEYPIIPDLTFHASTNNQRAYIGLHFLMFQIRLIWAGWF